MAVVSKMCCMVKVWVKTTAWAPTDVKCRSPIPQDQRSCSCWIDTSCKEEMARFCLLLLWKYCLFLSHGIGQEGEIRVGKLPALLNVFWEMPGKLQASATSRNFKFLVFWGTYPEEEDNQRLQPMAAGGIAHLHTQNNPVIPK